MAASDNVITSTEPIDDGLLVKPGGEIDFSRSLTLRAELIELMQNKPLPRLVIDLSAVSYMDSSGVATLVEVMQQQRKESCKLVLCGMQPKVQSIFEIARLDTVFTICENAKEAAKA